MADTPSRTRPNELISHKSPFDCVVVVGFIVFSILHFLGRWRGVTPFIYLSGDPGDICSYVAGELHPEAFRSDLVLADISKLDYYVSIVRSYLKLAISVVGDCGLSTLLLFIPVISLQGTGFYALGKYIWRSRTFGLILSLLTLHSMDLNLGEIWGINRDPMPRMLFQSLLPWLLILFLKSINSGLKLKVFVIFGLGALQYVHAVSAPVLGAAVLGSYAFYAIRTRELGKFVALCSLYFLLIAPFLIIYFSNRAYGSNPEFSQLMPLIRDTLHPEFFDVRIAAWGFITKLAECELLYIFGVCSAASILLIPGAHNKQLAAVAILIFAAALGIPLVEQLAEASQGWIPALIDLVRGLRYLIPMGWIFTVALLNWIHTGNLPRKLRKGAVAILAVLLLLAYPPYICEAVRGVAYLIQDRRTLTSWEANQLEILTQLKRHGFGNKIAIFGGVEPLYLRYAFHQAIFFVNKDAGNLIYGNLAKFKIWSELKKSVEPDSDGCKELAYDSIKEMSQRFLVDRVVITPPFRLVYTKDVCNLTSANSDGDAVSKKNSSIVEVLDFDVQNSLAQ